MYKNENKTRACSNARSCARYLSLVRSLLHTEFSLSFDEELVSIPLFIPIIQEHRSKLDTVQFMDGLEIIYIYIYVHI